MNLVFDEDQEEFRSAVGGFLVECSPEAEVRRLSETVEGHDPAIWSRMAGELELQGLTVPEAYGGGGYGPVEASIVFEEMGKVLLCSPYFATTALAIPLLLGVDDDAAKADLLPGIADGTVIATVGLLEDGWSWDPSAVKVHAERHGNRWLVSGEKQFVLDATIAQLLIVVARADDGVSLFAVERGAPGLTTTAVSTLDQTRKQGRVSVKRTPARLIGSVGAGWEAVAGMLEHATVALAAEQVGGAQAILDLTVQYARDRVQFGRPIGSFQAIKHTCANMLALVEQARSSAYYGAWAAAEAPDERSIAAAVAGAYASDAYLRVAAAAIQVHGGIGFTWEHPAHLYFKRAKTSQLLFGGGHRHRARLAELICV